MGEFLNRFIHTELPLVCSGEGLSPVQSSVRWCNGRHGQLGRGEEDSGICEVGFIHLLGGGFKYFLFSHLFGEDSHFDEYFSKGLKPPTRFMNEQVRYLAHVFWTYTLRDIICFLQKVFAGLTNLGIKLPSSKISMMEHKWTSVGVYLTIGKTKQDLRFLGRSMYVRDYRFMCFTLHICTKSTLSLAYDLLACRCMVRDRSHQSLDLLSEASRFWQRSLPTW